MLPSKSAAKLNEIASAESSLPRDVLLQLIRRCLQVSATDNTQLTDSASHLAQLIGDKALAGKIKRLCLLGASISGIPEEELPSPFATADIGQQELSLQQAATMLESIKQNILKRKVSVKRDVEEGHSIKRWVLAKAWNPCPIGMLPDSFSSSGLLPILECTDNCKEKDTETLNPHGVKRPASPDLLPVEDSTVECRELSSEDGIPTQDGTGYLFVGGVWKKIGEEELLAIESDLVKRMQSFNKRLGICSGVVGTHDARVEI